MAIEKDLRDQLLAGRNPKDVFNKDGLVDELKKALSERILNTELDEHLDSDGAEGKSNHRNGYSKKSVLTGTSKMTLSVPRDRAGTFDPKLIAKYQRRFPDFESRGGTPTQARARVAKIMPITGWESRSQEEIGRKAPSAQADHVTSKRHWCMPRI